MTDDPGRRRLPPALSGPLLGLVLIALIFTALIGVKGGLEQFYSLDNVQVLVHGSTVIAVLSLAMLLIIVSGGIDLSVGSVVALATVMAMAAYRLVLRGPDTVPILADLRAWGIAWTWTGTESQPLASAAAVAAGLATGMLCGLVNGLVITKLRLTPFVATLGMLSVARGLAVGIAHGHPLAYPRDGRPGWVDAMTEVHARWTFFSPGFWTMLLLAGVVALVLHRTVLGRYCYAIGSNEATARLCGVAVERTKVWIYVLAGFLTGWAGVLAFTRVGGDPTGSVGLELEVIAAVVIGGASLTGGRGTVTGTLLGVLILGMLQNGVSMFSVPVEVKYILIGVIIVANTALSGWQRRDG
jgi:ribose/xylose/arabinose/galactoside ABC-type transport system permease subunit